MKIILAGGSGQVGQLLAGYFTKRGDEIVVLTRGQTDSAGAWRYVHWDAQTLGNWAALLDGADVLVNLAGRSVNCRYTPKNRREILNSRLDSTRVLGEAVSKVDRPPRIWLQSSTATIYRHTFDRPNDEFTGVLGGDEPDAPDTWRFSIGVATRWEQAATQVNLPNTRLVLLRSAMIMTPDRGGVFDTLQWLTHLGLSGPVAGGVQYMSWVHGTDFCRALAWIIEHPDLSGPVNIASPNPLPHKEFMAELRRAAGVPFGLPATAWMVEIASFFLRTESELILKSRWVVPGKLLKSGFEFKFPEWESAAAELVQK